MEFAFKIGIIRQRISDYFGYEAISKILFESAYEAVRDNSEEMAAPEPDAHALAVIRDTAKDIDDEELREVFEAFCEAALRVKEKL